MPVKPDRAAEEASLTGLIRATLGPRVLQEKRMFGGTCFLLDGHMVCGTYKDGVLFRVGEAVAEEALARRGARPFVMQGRVAKGYVDVAGSALPDPEAMRWFIDKSLAFVGTLAPKPPASARPKRS